MSTIESSATFTDLTYGYSLLNGVVVDVDEEPVEILNHCNCDVDFLCSNPECIDRQMKMESYYGRRNIAPEWTEYFEKWKANK
jgi:hypothetical protein